MQVAAIGIAASGKQADLESMFAVRALQRLRRGSENRIGMISVRRQARLGLNTCVLIRGDTHGGTTMLTAYEFILL